MVSGYLSITKPEHLEKGISKMLNKILLSEDPLLHAQKFASLSNAWINCRKLSIDTDEIEKIRKQIAELRDQIAESREK